MTEVWVTIAALAVATVLIKAAGPLTVGGRDLPPRVTAVIAACLSAIVVGWHRLATGAEEAAIERDLPG